MKIRQIFGIYFVAGLTLISAQPLFGAESVSTQAEWPEMSLEVGMDTNSRYITDGFAGSESFVLQPQATAAVGDLSFNVWSNFNLNEDSEDLNNRKFNEVDLTLDYRFEFRDFSFVPRGVYYVFPNTE